MRALFIIGNLMAIEIGQRSFQRLPRNSTVRVNQSKSFPPPSSRDDGIRSTERPEHRVPSRELSRDSSQEFCPTSFTLSELSSSILAEHTYDGSTHLRMRSNLSPVEELHLGKTEKDQGRRGGLEVFPKFFSNYKEASLELKQGLFNVWSTFLIAETLLSSLAIQPFVSNISNLSGWKLKVYGAFWMLVVVSGVMSFAITAFFLGYLHAYPGKLTYMWLCHIGQWADIPSLVVLIVTFITLAAVGFSSWVIYGTAVGICCVVIEVLVGIFGIYTHIYLAKAGKAMEALE